MQEDLLQTPAVCKCFIPNVFHRLRKDYFFDFITTHEGPCADVCNMLWQVEMIQTCASAESVIVNHLQRIR